MHKAKYKKTAQSKSFTILKHNETLAETLCRWPNLIVLITKLVTDLAAATKCKLQFCCAETLTAE